MPHSTSKAAVVNRFAMATLLGRLATLALLTALVATAGLSSLTAAPLPASEAAALDRKILADAVKGSEIMANLTYISDVIGPRLTGSAALQRASAWTAERMKVYGLEQVRLEAYPIP